MENSINNKSTNSKSIMDSLHKECNKLISRTVRLPDKDNGRIVRANVSGTSCVELLVVYWNNGHRYEVWVEPWEVMIKNDNGEFVKIENLDFVITDS